MLSNCDGYYWLDLESCWRHNSRYIMKALSREVMWGWKAYTKCGQYFALNNNILSFVLTFISLSASLL